MKRAKTNYAATRDDRQSTGEILILPDGRVLAHNLTPALAQILSTLAPDDEEMRRRAGQDATAAPNLVRHTGDQNIRRSELRAT